MVVAGAAGAWAAARRPSIAGGLGLLAAAGAVSLALAVLTRHPGLFFLAGMVLGGEYTLSAAGHAIEILPTALYSAAVLAALELAWSASEPHVVPVGPTPRLELGPLLLLVPAAVIVSLVAGMVALGGYGAGAPIFVVGVLAAGMLAGLVVLTTR